MSEEQKDAVLSRAFNRVIDLGGNVFYLAKIAAVDGVPFFEVVGGMSGMSLEDYRTMMNAGGRSPEGNRSIKEGC